MASLLRLLLPSHHPLLLRSAVAGALLALLSAGFPARAQEPVPPAATSFSALGDEVVEKVRTLFYDARSGEAWAKENAGYAKDIRDAAAFSRATNERLDRLGVSHTRFYGLDDPGSADLLSIFEPIHQKKVEVDSLGLGLVPEAGGWFVARVFAGGAAEKAGLLRGDRITALDGAPFDPVRSTRGRAGTPVTLEVERQRGAPLLRFAVTPRKVDPKAEWEAALSGGARIEERAGRRIGYVPVWSCAGVDVADGIREAFTGPLAEAEALVIDFRGGWGGCDPVLLHLFLASPGRLESVERDGNRTVYPPLWERPLVVLIDGGSRSGKEVVARALQRVGRATLVGERTAGAVVAGRFLTLADGSILYLAVHDVRVDGERLEGKGVAPDLAVAAGLLYAAGRDPQREAALDKAAALAAGRGKEGA